MLQDYMVKYDLPTERYTISVVLGSSFLNNYATDRLIRHCHGQYEVQFQWHTHEPDSGSFRIIPPGVWHTGRLREPGDTLQLASFVFTVRDRKDPCCGTAGTTLESFFRLSDEISVPDTFGGCRLIHEIRQELQEKEPCIDRIYALLQLLMVELAQKLPSYVPQTGRASACASEEFLPEQIERFLTLHYHEPECSRERLAKHLNVSERQLGRLLEQIYRKSFRQIILERRMEFAESWRITDGLSAAEAAQKVGYASVRGFCEAYEKYHGKKYKEETGGI